MTLDYDDKLCTALHRHISCWAREKYEEGGYLHTTLQMFSAGLQASYRDFGVQGYQNCRGYV